MEAQGAQQITEILDQLKNGLEKSELAQHFSQSQLDVIYKMAYDQLVQGKYEKSLEIFSFLSLYRPTHFDYLMGAGLCLQALELYHMAIQSFCLACVFHPKVPYAAFHIAQCYMGLEEQQKAHEYLMLTIKSCKEHSGFDELLIRAENLLAALEKKDSTIH